MTFSVCNQSAAQIFGGNPPGLKFYQFNTDTVKVIFPKQMEQQAREIVWLAHELVKQSPAPLGAKFKKFSIVLQNQTTESNAYVGPAPWRSEFYMMPDLNNLSQTSQQWHQTLTVHEERHMHQFANFKRGVQKLGGFFLGQEGQVALMGIAVPDWFFEGDAVWQETVTTLQGRGRLPNFFNPYRSLWLANKNYSYQKLRNGSYRHYVPNHYDLGYLLVSYGREKYGNEFWQKVTSDALDFKGLFYPFQKAVKRHSGTSFPKFINNSFEFYKKEMKIAESSLYETAQPITQPQKNSFTTYQFPFVMEDGSILALKSTFRQIPVWVKIDNNGKEKKLRVKDIADDAYYSYKNGMVVYTAFEPDARWGWKNYSVLKLWNTETKEVKELTFKTRLFQPDISADHQKAVAVHIATDGKNALNIISTSDGASADLTNKNNFQYTYPRFTTDGLAIISAVRNNKGEMTLAETNIATGNETLLMPFTNTPIGFVQVQGDTVLFTASMQSKDVLYLFNKKDGSLSTVANLPNGNYQAVMDIKNNSVLFNSFSADGIMILKQPLKTVKQEQLLSLQNLYRASAEKKNYKDFLEEPKQYNGEVKKYRALYQPINIHSWRPQLGDPEYGITFYGENVLNTLTSEYNYTYNRNEGFHQVGMDVLFGRWFPVLRGGISQAFNRNTPLNNDTLITWNQTNANIGFSIPLNLTKGKTLKSFNFTTSFNTEQLYFTGFAKTRVRNDNFNYISSSLSFINQSQRARQHIYPRWAQTFRLQYKHTVNGETGKQFFANTGFYLPGIHPNHNLVLFGSVYARDTIRGNNYSNNFPFARGYNSVNFPRAFRLSANYHFPLVYPEFGIGNMVYFLRIRANAFYDYTRGRSLRTGRVFPLRSAGAELFFDTRIWNLFPATVGIRYSRLLDVDRVDPLRDANQFEIVLPVALF